MPTQSYFASDIRAVPDFSNFVKSPIISFMVLYFSFIKFITTAIVSNTMPGTVFLYKQTNTPKQINKQKNPSIYELIKQNL